MQFKNKLLSGVVASAAIFGLVGTASAIEVSSVSVGAIATAATATLPPADDNYEPLKFAAEANFAAGVTGRDRGNLVLTIEPSTGTLPSGNIVLELNLTNAVFNTGGLDGTAFDWDGNGLTDLVAAALGCTSVAGSNDLPLPTANISTGGAAGDSQVRFIISNLNTCEPGEAFSLNIPVNLTGAGSVSATVGLETEGGLPVDGGPESFIAIEVARAFDVAYGTATSSQADRTADVVTAYRQFTATASLDAAGEGALAVGNPPVVIGNRGRATLGGAALVIDADVLTTLSGAPTGAVNTDVDAISFTFTGDFGAYQPDNDGNVRFDAANILQDDLTTTSFTVEPAVASVEGSFNVVTGALTNGALVSVDVDGSTAINASTFTGSADVDLADGFVDIAGDTGSLGAIIRNGTSAILPWTASATQSAGSGSNNFVRVSNNSTTAFGTVRARVLSSTVPAARGVIAIIGASVPARGELLVTAADLEAALGNFGRGDIEISVEGNGAVITRLVQRTDGTYEINNR